jgi:type II secretion system protein I
VNRFGRLSDPQSPIVLGPTAIGRAGFTLIEVLVALVVVTAGLTIIAQGFLTGGRASVASQHGTMAVWLADSKMAELEAGILSTKTSGSGSFEPDQPDFSWEVDIQSTATTGLIQATVTITWKERNEERSFELVRLMKERSE